MTRRDTGQAMVECVVALVVLIVLFAGLLQLGLLDHAHTLVMKEARHDAALAVEHAQTAGTPEYIAQWREGADGVRYSQDDEFDEGVTADFRHRVTRYAHTDDLERYVAGQPFSALHGSSRPHDLFGLVRGGESAQVPLFPAVRHLLYRAALVEFDCEVWLAYGGEIY